MDSVELEETLKTLSDEAFGKTHAKNAIHDYLAAHLFQNII